MTEPGQAAGLLLWSRAALLAVVAVSVGTLAHVSADGLLPGPLPLLLLTAAATAFAGGFLRRPAHGLRLAALLASGQAAVHAALSLMAGHADVGSTAVDAAAHSAHGSHAVSGTHAHGSAPTEPFSLPDRAAAAADVAVALLLDQAQHLVEDGGAMVLAHLAAAALLGLWLGVGERALWTLLALAAAPVHAAAAGVLAGALSLRLPVLRPVVTGATQVVVPLPASRWAPRALARRGPPALLAA